MRNTIALLAALLFLAAAPRVVKNARVINMVMVTADSVTLTFDDGTTFTAPKKIFRIDDRRGLPAPRLTLAERREIREEGRPRRAETIEDVALLGPQPIVLDVKYNARGRAARVKLHLYPSHRAARAAAGETAAER